MVVGSVDGLHRARLLIRLDPCLLLRSVKAVFSQFPGLLVIETTARTGILESDAACGDTEIGPVLILCDEEGIRIGVGGCSTKVGLLN